MKTTRDISVETGLDVFLEMHSSPLVGQRVGLITNATGVDRHLHSTVDRLYASRQVRLLKLFGPEHGIRGEAQAGVEVRATVDGRTGLPVYSLYGETRRPTQEMLTGLDALLFDIQDVGVRYATYLSTLAYALEAAATAGLTFVVFDRPNPLTGTHVEGNLLDPAYTSFVGVHPLPIRHGLTVGEFARLFAAEQGLPAPVVVPMRRWRREQWFDQTGLPWVQPSPNLPTLDALTLYPGTCLLEGTNLSEGRGTTRPFEVFGAPWLDPFALLDYLETLDLAGVAFRPTYFTPAFSKFQHSSCAGLQLHITDREAMQSVQLGLHLLQALRHLYPKNFTWVKRQDGSYFIDSLLSNASLRHAIDAGRSISDIVKTWDIASFEERRRPLLLYEEGHT